MKDLNYFAITMSFFPSILGVILTGIDWSYDESVPRTLSISASADVTLNSRNLDGSGLWTMGLFGSTNGRGLGNRLGHQQQILNLYNQGRTVMPPRPITFRNIDTRFNIEQLGCNSEYQYLCLELSKGANPNPEFSFRTIDGDDSLMSCKQRECRGKLQLRYS